MILAIGQQADLSFLTSEDRVELSPQGTIKVDPQTLATSAPGCSRGDVAGPRNLIEAVANGKRAALSIDDYLRGVKTDLVVNLRIEELPTRSYTRPEDYEKCERKTPPVIALDRRTGISEVELYDRRLLESKPSAVSTVTFKQFTMQRMRALQSLRRYLS